MVTLMSDSVCVFEWMIEGRSTIEYVREEDSMANNFGRRTNEEGSGGVNADSKKRRD